jgi:phosphoglycerol transferase
VEKLKSVPKIFKYLLLLVGAFFLSLSIYIKNGYDVASFEQLLYTITNAEGTGMDSIKGAILPVVVGTVLLFALFLVPFFTVKLSRKVYLNVTVKKKKHLIPISYTTHKLAYSIVVFILAMLLALWNFDFYTYVKNQLQVSTIYEEYYIDPKTVELSFPSKKQNLIYIYVESLEMTNASRANGGDQKNSYIPELERLALNNVNFSNQLKLGGATQVNGTGWTVAGMVAQTSGINMKVDVDTNSYVGYSSFMGGATNLGDILKENGYKNYILMGSDAKFGGRSDLFSQHGDYEIMDLIEMRNRGKLPYDYMTWWGYEDVKLFEYAKEKLTEVSKSDEPFNVTLLTADTHFQDGFVEEGCPELFDHQYANVFHCSDAMIAEFVEWAQKQDFAKDTTIIIVGDHLSMQRNFYEEDGYDRTVYDAIINPRVEPVREKDRAFTSLDMFPTTLAALGVKIKGDRLALGTNLFSGRDTLLEELGFEEFDGQLSRRSVFYNNKILGDSYYEMQETIKESK